MISLRLNGVSMSFLRRLKKVYTRVQCPIWHPHYPNIIHGFVFRTRTSWAKPAPQKLKFQPKQRRRFETASQFYWFLSNESNGDFAKVEWWCFWVCLANRGNIGSVFHTPG